MRFRIGMVVRVIRSAGLGWATLAFLAVFLVCCLLIALFDPQIAGSGNVLWYCFQAVTTIGYGDVVPTSGLARVVTVILSVVSIFYIAAVTGAVVSVCNEMLRLRRDASVAAFQHKLEHLEDLSRGELAELSRKVRELRG